MKRVCLLFLLLSLLLWGCGEKKERISTEDAIKAVSTSLAGSAESMTNWHVHTGKHDGRDCFQIYVTVDGTSMQYIVDSYTGEILHSAESDHSH